VPWTWWLLLPQRQVGNPCALQYGRVPVSGCP